VVLNSLFLSDLSRDIATPYQNSLKSRNTGYCDTEIRYSRKIFVPYIRSLII
jgi:hypothetical protein